MEWTEKNDSPSNVHDRCATIRVIFRKELPTKHTLLPTTTPLLLHQRLHPLPWISMLQPLYRTVSPLQPLRLLNLKTRVANQKRPMHTHLSNPPSKQAATVEPVELFSVVLLLLLLVAITTYAPSSPIKPHLLQEKPKKLKSHISPITYYEHHQQNKFPSSKYWFSARSSLI